MEEKTLSKSAIKSGGSDDTKDCCVEREGQATDHRLNDQQQMDLNGKRKNSNPVEKSSTLPSTSNSPPLSEGSADEAQSSLKKFFCPCCNIGHPTSEDLINHVREFPIKLETFSCDICMLEFFVKSDLINHQRLDHQVTTHKTFKCDECDLQYTNLSQLTRHKKMHEEIAKKLAACGVFLPNTKRPEQNMSVENPSGAVFPYRYPQVTDDVISTSEPEKESGRCSERENTEDKLKKEEVKPEEESRAAEKNTASSPVTKKRKTVQPDMSKEKSTSAHFYINLDTKDQEESDMKKSASDNDWQEYNSSDFASNNEDVSEDPDYHEKKRGRGRPRLTKKAKEKEKKVEIKRAEDNKERKARAKKERQERARRRRENTPAPKKPQEEVEEIEAPAHLKNKDGSIQCPDCDVICYSLRGLNRHRKYHFRTMDKLKCILCEEVFTDKLSMNSHMSREHKLRQNKSADTPSGSKEFRCSEPDCQEVFSSNIALSKHRVKDHGIEKSQLHCCEHCGKMYPSNNALKIHMRMHTDERPFVCTLCSKAYRSSGGLLWHLKSHETTEDILNKYKDVRMTEEGHYACELCGKEFKSMYGIRLHKENPQKKCSATPGYWGKWKPKPAMCEVCGREFPSKVTLKSHMVTHTGERPFKCRYCEATFKHHKTKFVHEKVHKNQRDYLCKVCGKAFYDGTNLRTHIARHKEVRDLPCQLCGKLFHVEISRRRHEQRCRNFIRCPICSSVFRQQERLRRHIMINHHGAQMPNSDWLSAQPVPYSECSSTEPVIQRPPPPQTMDNRSNSSSKFAESFSLFVDHQPPQASGQC